MAIARALAVRPRVLLLDEPLSALDAQIRRSMVEEIARLHADLPELTILYVTHDQSEALTLADRIAILKDGELSAIGRTGELYRRPPNRFAAEFLGRANLLPVVVEGAAREGGFVGVRLGGTKVIVAGANEPSGAERLLCVRPQNLTLTGDAERSNRIEAVLTRDPLAGRIDAPRRSDRRVDLARRRDAIAESARARRQARGLLLAFGREPDRGRRGCLTRSRWRRAAARVSLGGWWIAPPLIVLGLFFLYPLILIARAALIDDSGALNFGAAFEVLNSRAFLNASLNTAEIAVASTVGCVMLGLTLGLIFAFAPFPGAGFVAQVIDTFIALPTFLVTLAFTFLYGSAGILNGALTSGLGLDHPPVDFLYSAWGVILAEVTVYTPFVLRPLLAAFSLVDRSQIEVASLLGARPLRIVRQVILPAALPAIVAGGSLCLLLTVNEFGIVLFIGAKGVITLPLLIYSKAIQESDYQGACAIAIVNVALSLALFSLYRSAARRLGG